MPAETVLVGPVQVRRLPDGSRDILCVHGPNAATAIRVLADGVEELRGALAMDESEMQDAQARQHAAQRLVVPNGVVGR